MNISIKQFKIIEAIIEHHSYTDAAKAMFMTQPAISMQVKQIEQQIGLPLFERSGKQIIATEAGSELMHYAINIRQQLEEAETIIEELKGLKRGKLNLTMAATANYFAPRLIAAFHHQYPGAQVTLNVTNRSGLLAALDHNTTDMAIMGVPPERLKLTGIPFMENPLVVIAWPTHPLAKRKSIRLSEVANEEFILREPDSGTRMASERYFAEHQLSLTPRMEMNRTEAIKQAVMAELGLGIVSLHTLEMELALKRLIILHVEDFPIMRHWYIVHRNNKRFSAIPAAFKEFAIRESRSLLETPQY
ncbi:MAG: LysR family transcriptional regulator [Mariprofundus sp.]|nr:LysR family transcriptional regulator [Mariprofundus sp.]